MKESFASDFVWGDVSLPAAPEHELTREAVEGGAGRDVPQDGAAIPGTRERERGVAREGDAGDLRQRGDWSMSKKGRK